MEMYKDHISYMIETEPTMSVSKIVNRMNITDNKVSVKT